VHEVIFEGLSPKEQGRKYPYCLIEFWSPLKRLKIALKD